MLSPLKIIYDQPRQHIKKQRYCFANKGLSSQGYGFSSSHVWMWDLEYKESWAPKNWCFWTMVLEKTLEIFPLDFKKIKPVNPEENLFWIFIGRTDDEAPILWPPDVKNWLIWKDPDAGKDWRQEEKGTTGDEMVGWHHRLSGHEFEQAPGVGDRQGSLACHSPWGGKELDMTEHLNWLIRLFHLRGFKFVYHIWSIISDWMSSIRLFSEKGPGGRNLSILIPDRMREK